MSNSPLASLLEFGLVGIAALSLLEKFLPVAPSYVLLVLFGLGMGDTTGDLVGTVLASTLGSVAGAVCWYCLGRLIGLSRSERLVDRFGKYILLRPELYRRLVAAYRRRHFLVTFFGQTVPTVRIYLALPAGVMGLPFASFMLATTLGTLVWNAPLITVGYLMRDTGWSPAAVGGTLAMTVICVEALAMLFTTWARHRRLEQRPL